MKIGLIDVDSHRWPNLCLMKLSAYHKAQGAAVEWWRPEGRYDLIYKSRVFTDTYSKDTITVTNADRLICGGTGYGPRPDLPDAVEHTRPDCDAYVDFSQGLDIRLITSDNVALLNKVRTKTVHFAWDNPNADLIGFFQRFSELSKIRDFRRKRVYVLTNWNSTHEQDLYRVDTLRRMGFDPYVMVYERPTAPLITRHLQRWVNNKQIFRTVESFADYEPVKKPGGEEK